MARFTLTGFAVLREVARVGSFTAAAGALGYTQSAVSRQIATLERAAGVPLVRRTRRGAALTPAGSRLLEHAEAALAHAAAAEADFGGRAMRRLRLGALPTALAVLVPAALTELRLHRPDVEVELREGTTDMQLRRLQQGRLDAAVVARGGEPGDGAVIIDDPLLIAVAQDHPLAAEGLVTPAALRDEQWIVGSTHPASALLGALVERGHRPRIAHVARDWTAKLGLVAAGHGVTVVPAVAAASVRRDVVLLAVDADPIPSRPLAILTTSTTDRHVQEAAAALERAARQAIMTGRAVSDQPWLAGNPAGT